MTYGCSTHEVRMKYARSTHDNMLQHFSHHHTHYGADVQVGPKFPFPHFLNVIFPLSIIGTLYIGRKNHKNIHEGLFRERYDLCYSLEGGGGIWPGRDIRAYHTRLV